MDIPKTLADRLRAHKVVPFIGAGVSMAVVNRESGERLFPSWKTLLERAAEFLDQEKQPAYANLVRGFLQLDKPKYIEAAEQAREGLGPVWFTFLQEQIDRPRERASNTSLKLAESVWELGSLLLITTNYDKVLHWACPQRDNLTRLDNDASAELNRAASGDVRKPTVWHLHGHIDNSANLVLTPDGYSRLYPEAGQASGRYEAALKTLHQLMTSHSLLFIGYSLDDTYLGMQLRGISDIFQGSTGPHYVLARAADRERITALNLPVQIITVEDYGPPLLDGLRKLAEIAKEHGSHTTGGKVDPNQIVHSVNVASYDPRNRVFYVPFRPKGDQVIGREETMRAVREQLTSGRRTAIGQTAAFQGLGGLGKTQLAVEYAYLFQNEYPNGVIWVNADQDIDSQLIHIAEKARWVAPESEHKYKLEIALQRIRTYSDCLLVFDNVEGTNAIEPYLPEPQASPHILITSRLEQPGFKPVQLKLLDHELSLKLLLQEAGREQTPAEEDEERAAREIANTLEGLPLALELAGAYIRHRQLPWRQYLGLLQQNLRAALSSRFLGGSFTKHEKDIYSTLKINEGIFQDEPLLRDVLNLLTWSGSAPMGLSLMCPLLDIPNEAELTGALSLGIALRLLQKPPAAESYAIHRLVREVRREDVPLTGQESWIDTICQRMAKWFEDKREEFNQLPLFESEIDHLQAWEQHASAYAPKYASQLIWLQAYPSHHHGRYHDVRAQLEKAWAVFEQSNSSDLALKAHILNDLGFSYFQLGDYPRALELYQKALEIRRELFGDKHPDTGTSIDGVGSAYGGLGDHKRALEFHQKALEIYQELLGDRHPSTATSFNDIGNVYGGMGDHKRALEFQQKALEIYQELLGDRHPSTATSFHNVGGTYGNLGDHKRALELEQKALGIRQELFGDRHPSTAASFNNVGSTYGEMGDHKRALELQQKALEIYQELFGDKHPSTATSFNNVGNTYREMGDHKRALMLTQRALEIRQKLFGDRHPHTATSFNDIGNAYGGMGDHKRALEFQQKALEIYQELLGDRHPHTATSFNNVGSTYGEMGDHKRALELQQKALEIRRDLLGKYHPHTAISVVNVMHSLFNLNRHLQARQIIEDYFRGLPSDHPSYEMVREQRQELLRKMPGFRIPPTSKQRKGKHKKKGR